MVTERSICLDGKTCTAVISDEPEALLAAKAAGRAVVGVESERTGIWELKGIPYVIPDIEDATDELLDLVIRRHLGLPWNICRTDRLLIRELTADDACHIPEEEYGPEEAIFRLRDTLELYCRNQYGFYEYGTWALVRRDDQVLVGLAGVSNPRLKREMNVWTPWDSLFPGWNWDTMFSCLTGSWDTARKLWRPLQITAMRCWESGSAR